MTTALPLTGREIRLRTAPDGLPRPEHFTVSATPLPSRPGPGHVLVRNQHFLVFPGLRTLIGGEAAGVPLPPLRPGDALFGPAVGEVVAAGDGSALRPGDAVLHLLGWREYAVVAAADCTPLGERLPAPVDHLSQGSSAYGALTRLAELAPGETVFITGAAGAVGSLAGQIARLLGAGRVIGSTGSPAKAERLRTELGYDAVVLRGAPASVAEQLADAAPEGIDVTLDLVGGEQLTAAVGASRPGARIALVGALSGQFSPDGDGGSAPASVDTFRLVNQGITLRGYRGADHPDAADEWKDRFGAWLRAGAIRFPYTRIAGMDRAPEALQGLFDGRHFGAVVVEL
ncbi:MDR family NADP-dependent oxidoreductase [Streptomyces beijiangensis]|uniref:NADP-dependent oxidoreductase n=1 Tax=Streptomyces beijiangensis TaxID=163361 RepID=A0A939F584_9ACTN|nr:NADP-dependent oxidoreductase [Streptomyces beijiangensis]MBO0512530.1 NADP-dependent oxidoreductase [Streptomyces beijiangensis]